MSPVLLNSEARVQFNVLYFGIVMLIFNYYSFIVAVWTSQIWKRKSG